jgi:hypothetical protein
MVITSQRARTGRERRPSRQSNRECDKPALRLLSLGSGLYPLSRVVSVVQLCHPFVKTNYYSPVIVQLIRRSSPRPFFGHLDRDRLGILGAHHPHLRQIDPVFGPWQVKVNRLVFVESERLVRKVLNALARVTVEGDGDAGGWHPAAVRKGKVFIFIQINTEPREPFTQSDRSTPFGPSCCSSCGFAPFSPTVQRLAELTESDAYGTAQERGEDRQHDLQPNGHHSSIAQTGPLEPTVRTFEVDVAMTRRRASGQLFAHDRWHYTQRVRRTAAIRLGTREPSAALSSRRARTSPCPTCGGDHHEDQLPITAVHPPKSSTAMGSTVLTSQPDRTTMQQSGTSERGADVQSATVLLLACDGKIPPPAERSSPWRPAQAGRSAIDHDQLLTRISVQVSAEPRLAPPGAMEPEGPVRAVRADNAPHRDGLRQFADEPGDLRSEPQPVTQHQHLVLLGDHWLPVVQGTDLNRHHIIKMEAAHEALPAGQVRGRPRRLPSPAGVPGEQKDLATPDDSLTDKFLQPRRKLCWRHPGITSGRPKHSGRKIVQPHSQHSTKPLIATQADIHPCLAGGDRYRIFAITCPFSGNARLRWIRDTDPDTWADLVAFDREIRHGSPRAIAEGKPPRGQFFVHRSLKPLDQVDLDPPTCRHLRVVDGTAVEDNDPDRCSPWSCRSGEPVHSGSSSVERAA